MNSSYYRSFNFLFCARARLLTVLCFCRTYWQVLDHPCPHRSPMFTLHVMSCTFSKLNYGVHCTGDKRGGWRVHKFGKYVASYLHSVSAQG